MERLAILDISTFIWDREDFDRNTTQYYGLMSVLPSLYTGLIENDIPIVMRGKLHDEIFAYFPYDIIPGQYRDFQNSTLFFLTGIRKIEYNAKNDASISSVPELAKKYFRSTTKKEIRYLITYLHNGDSSTKRMLAFNIFWNHKGTLRIFNDKLVEIKTLLCDDPQTHETIILSLKKIFEHNRKHDAYKSSSRKYYGEVISSLSCYNDRKKDKTKAQKLLDKARKYEGDYYNYDESNQTYIKFVLTRDNIYHGFNVKPGPVDLINLRKIFHK